MKKILKTTQNFLIIQIFLLLISMILALFSFSIKIFIAQIILIILTYFSFKKLNEGNGLAVIITTLTGIVGVIIGFTLTNVLVTIFYGAILIQILKIILYPMGMGDNVILKIIFNIIGIACILGICYFSLNNKLGLSGSIEDALKNYNKIQLSTSIPEVEKAIGKRGEKEEMERLMLLNFYSNRDKGYKVTAYFDKSNNSKCKTKTLSYDKSTLNEDLGKETISFNNFDKIKEQKEKSSLNYYLKHSKEFDKEYKTLEEYKLDNMIYLSDIKENLGDEGIEIEKEIYLENIREKYLFADKNSNYIIVYVQENNIFSMEGNVNGEEIDWNII